MMDKVLCPWCGSEMWLNGINTICWYFCAKCKASAPEAHTELEALEKALCRFKPMQQPLTLEEAVRERAVWVEFPDELEEYAKDDRIEAVVFESYCSGDNQCVLVGDDLDDSLWLDDRDYNDRWRCWATKPTDEERKAAKWDERIYAQDNDV